MPERAREPTDWRYADLVAEIERLREAVMWCSQFLPYQKEEPLPEWIVKGRRRVEALIPPGWKVPNPYPLPTASCSWCGRQICENVDACAYALGMAFDRFTDPPTREELFGDG